MATDLEALQALERRGKLPDVLRPLYDEAIKRGLIKESGPRAKAGPPLTWGETGTDVAKSLGSGAVLGTEGLAGMSGTVNDWVGKGVQYVARKAGIPDPPPIPPHEQSFLERAVEATRPPTGQEISDFREQNIGQLHTPETEYGKGAETLGEFVPAILGGPAGAFRQAIARVPQRVVTHALTQGPRAIAKHAVTQTVLPAAGSEIAGRATEGTWAEPYARFGGAALGGGFPYLASRAVTAGARPGGPLATLSRGSAQYAANAAPTAAQVAELQRLGPEAMLADVSPEWHGVSRGAASRPGHRDAIVNALLERQTGANQRLGQDLDTSLGAVRNPGRTEEYLSASREALGPQYQQAVRGGQAVNTQGIADTLDTLAVDLRGPAQQAVQRVRGYLNIPGQQVLDPSPRALLETRHAIDGLMAAETNPQVVRQLTSARAQIDQEIARAVPGIKDVDAQFAELSRQSEGLTRGSQVLDSGKTAIRPEDLAQEMQQGALPQGTQVGPSGVPARMREGARAEIDRVAGTNANDAVALQHMVKGKGDWNRDKLRTLFGPQADDALNAIDRESLFNQTRNTVVSGSPTAMTNQFGEFLNEAAKPPTMPLETTLPGLVVHYGQRGLRKLLGTNAEARAQRYAGELGRASVATGAERDALVAAIQDYARRRTRGPTAAGQTMARAALLQALLSRRDDQSALPPRQ
jgi:hypothetical protein